MSTPPPARPPAALVLAGALVAFQGLALVVYAILEAASVSSGRVAMGATTSAFFAAYGALLVGCGWALTRGRGWARSPAVLAQLIWLGVAWSFRGGDTAWVAAVLVGVGLVVLVGILLPASTAVLTDRE